MQEISAAVEDTATSAGNINSGERRLSQAIADINNAAEKIIEVLKFITEIASQTKMLGLDVYKRQILPVLLPIRPFCETN